MIENMIENLREAARDYYSNPALTYHNWNHIETVIQAYTQLWGEPEPTPLMAMLYHDCIYVPGAPAGMNEELSATAFLHEFNIRESLSDCSAFEDTLRPKEVFRLIRATATANHVAPEYWPHNAFEARVLDCDISSLGCERYEQFVAQQDAILHELKGPAADLVELRPLAARFLQQFIHPGRSHIYHTSEAREAWEDKAQSNIARYCRELIG